MAWTQTDIDALDRAIGKGVRRVSYQSGSVDYHSLAEMIQLRDLMKAEIASGGAGTVTRSVAAYNNGLGHGFLFTGGWHRR